MDIKVLEAIIKQHEAKQRDVTLTKKEQTEVALILSCLRAEYEILRKQNP